MEMRDQDRVDRLGVDAGDRKTVGHQTGGRRELTGGAGIDEDQLCAGVDQERRERSRHDAGREK
jgi:hypothetical protein